ncbi:hypothetical protein [Pseudoalteromonas sp. CAL260-MNA-CIBAN-0059]|uniref:hypothetical protein n=1 Tax=unclassified Pseudoalteromonas TaxID=194690 RepID=UPI00331F13DA|tara:strand:- start:3394 stop:5406 length:2013 start_codon:yes stop_codon:yes gene_type:complete
MAKFVSSLQSSSNDDIILDKFDSSLGLKPTPSFILCRDELGNPTAIYSQNKWNFNPVKLGVAKVPVIDFKREVSGKVLTDSLINEIKSLLFTLIYLSSNNGRTGRLSAIIAYQYFRILRNVGFFCIDQSNSVLQGISIREVLSNANYLSIFVETQSNSALKILSDLLLNLNNTENRFLDFTPVNKKLFDVDYRYKQTPVIPSRIYIELMNILGSEIDFIYCFKDRLFNFIKEFKNEKIGYGIDTQLNTIKGLGIKNGLLSTLDELIDKADLKNLFVKHYAVSNKQQLMKAFTTMQYLLKLAIHFYTGMRSAETLRLPFDCIKSAEAQPSIELGGNSIEPRIIKLISTTTKFSGYRQEASWLAPDAAEKAVEILQELVKGASYIYDVKASSLPVFQSLNVICFRETKAKHISDCYTYRNLPLFESLKITKEDRDELCASDPGRLFDETEFQIGGDWRIKSHQLRRSLAFYGSNSSFLSLPNVKKQFKYTGLAMAQYYRRNFNKLITIFGHYNEETKKLEVPKDHVLFEFQTGIPLDKAKVILEEVFNVEEKIFGKRGSYIERVRDGVGQDNIIIKEAIKDTEQRAVDGEISYKPTLLGGCMKSDKCDAFMLGEVTSCIGCSDSIIKLNKIELMITKYENEVRGYELNSFEYNYISDELVKLKTFKLNQVKD